jgi:hypothetical protein
MLLLQQIDSLSAQVRLGGGGGAAGGGPGGGGVGGGTIVSSRRPEDAYHLTVALLTMATRARRTYQPYLLWLYSPGGGRGG